MRSSTVEALMGIEALMSIYDVRPCPCGSGEESQWEFDAKGMPLDRMCRVCRKAKLARIPTKILLGYTQEDIDEPIEEDV
jgi:hypothetical protein